MTGKQLDLFSQMPPTPALRQEQLVMDLDALSKWKSQIFEYQQRVRESQPPQQTTLFDIAPNYCDPDKIDPLKLQLQPMSFYRMPTTDSGSACLYFVLDTAIGIILYVEETCRSNKRWKGVHDCKQYIENYQSLHYQHGMKTAINMTFWWEAPVETRPRQQLELSLILKWRSPFNFQNWHLFGQPFG